MIQVKLVFGQARCNVRTTGNTWQVSPIADNRRMQTLRGAVSNGEDMKTSYRGLRAPIPLKYAGAIGDNLRPMCSSAIEDIPIMLIVLAKGLS